MGITAPELLLPQHAVVDFRSSAPLLDEWLKRKALKNQTIGASRTFVVCESGGNQVVGFYALATGSVQRQSVSGALRRNMPNPLPVLVLGRLAVDERYHRRGIGAGLLKDAVLRSRQVAEQVGTKALLVHALSEEAKAFYLYWGFTPSEIQSSILLLPLW
ncbi:N-acetylglutamate synthase and related acetyltransferases|uniref:Acetyltransferase (GNAT) family protein n=1 Tax=Brenneria salicis ATCC 15712 = DSM 30166 TaxID=714314 RepID=A0A366I3P0_9GAMM|nr:GNAT family N-acetyltransferase [Brenneria salicis]NMN92672.1 N-acetylglutamate synthase and related acetyltransferases [Brenneria salicis ATCC 15712 = DSM 30166]RBP62493.1 acetyltransferase (GNAT) family protein [Brenneria salicis ATCC 15712 = DSM 30166]RLM30583.1 GNAT family N-acetyltransferase [Brenneria salicis ATCC 15712 = DSM 30166]